MKNLIKILPYLYIIVLLPVMLNRDCTPANELRYLSIANEALENGSFFAFTNHAIPYADKPPLYLWIIMLGKILFGSHQLWYIALFSVIPAIVIIKIMDRWIAPYATETTRLVAILAMMSTGLFLGLSFFLRMDMLMCMFIILALYSFFRLYQERDFKGKFSYLFPVFIFFAIFSKGPIGFFMPLVATASFLLVKKELKQFFKYWGLKTWSILILLCGSWFLAIYLEGGKDYLNNLLFHQTINRAIDAFHHKRPFYYYLEVYWYSLAPWALLIVVVNIFAIINKKYKELITQFFATVLVSTFIMLSCFSAKIDMYLAPTFPFMIYLSIILLPNIKFNLWVKLSIIIPSVIALLSPLGVIFILDKNLFPPVNNGFIFTATMLFAISGAIALVLLNKSKAVYKSIVSLSCGVLLLAFFVGMDLKEFNAYTGYGELCKEAKVISKVNNLSNYYVWDIRRAENMDVYLGKDIINVTPEDIISGECNKGVLLLSQKKLKRNNDLSSFFNDKDKIAIGRYFLIIVN